MLWSVVTDGDDGNGLKLEKISQFFHVLKLCLEKLAKISLWFAFPVKFRLILERFSIAFTANGRSDHVTMFSPRLLLTVYCFLVMVSSFMFARSTRIILYYSRILVIYFVET